MDWSPTIDRLAADLGVPPETRRKWRQRGVPYRLRDDIRDRASAEGLEIPRAAFDEFGHPTEDVAA